MGATTTTTIEIQEQEKLTRKIKSLTTYLKPYISKRLNELVQTNPLNVKIICDYITAEQNELNIKESTKETKIKILIHLSKFFEHKKTFYDMTKDDILEYLNNLRKSSSVDPTHKSVGTWNARQMLFLKFFKWLYSPDETNHKNRDAPDCMQGIKQLPRKEVSPYKPEDMWTNEEHAIFLKYCPSIRDRCYHAMANDTSARPHELLNLKIKDLKFKISSEEIQYAEITVNGKTGPRTLPLIDSIPYVKEWLLNHPCGDNHDSWFFVSLSDKNTNSVNQLLVNGLLKRYKNKYNRFFRKLLDSNHNNDDKTTTTTIPESDKSHIRNMLTKPWNLYIFRHSALTEKSRMKLSEHMLRNHAGWSINSNMPQRYIHYFGNESVRSILQAKGIIKENEGIAEGIELLKPRYCPNCNESNKHDSKFCVKCKMVLSYHSYQYTLENQKEKENQIKGMQEEVESLKSQVKMVMDTMDKLVTVTEREKKTKKKWLAYDFIDNGMYVPKSDYNE